MVTDFGDKPALPGDKDYSVSTEATQTHPPKFSTREKLCRLSNFPRQDHLQERRPWTRWITGAASLELFLNGTKHSVLFYLLLSSGTPCKQTLGLQM